MVDENTSGVGSVETPAAQVEEGAGTDWKAEARKWENRAKENLSRANANDDAAKRLSEYEEAQKSEAQKLAEAREKAEAEVARLTAERDAFAVEKLRAEVAASKAVPATLLHGATQDELEAEADALLAFKGSPVESVSLFPKADPSQGAKGSAVGGSTADRFAAFIEEKLS